ncbi:ABC transporter substrate-binding protein [Alicyclobacillus dauci]|uniref:Extracellular solute-binding protein n=1 Tax=Alicyclobacillus dauci TaxID=1475485 RepID=A0ABY6Z8J6_9BACL|nr:extracellular solute-binding protein [Alicyclobacillus dauci]WAH38375.1 extracellular solute-binding protein [Alicyclobacillus dauci]
MKKSKIALGVFLVGALTAAVGCGSGTSGSGGNGTGANGGGSSTNSSTKQTITFLHWRGEDVPTFNKIISEFEQKNPNITVQMQVIPSDQYIAQAQANLTGSHGADVFTSFPGAEFTAIAKAGLYTDLSGQAFIQDYNSNLLGSGQQDGKQLAVPYQVVFNMPVYNQDLFSKLGLQPPTDWNGFLQLCQKLKANGDTPIVFAGKVSAGQFFNDMVMNNVPDPKVFTGLLDGSSKLTDSGFLKTFQQLSELAKKGYFQNGPLGTSQDAATAIFAQGKSGMLALGSYQITPVNKDNNSAFKMGLMAPITTDSPDQAKYVGIDTTTFMLGVNAKSQHKAAAEKFIDFLSQPDIAAEYANGTSQMVTVKNVNYTDPALKAMEPELTKALRFQPMYTLTNQQVVDAVTNTVEDVISGTDPTAAAEKGQKAIDQALSQK